MNYTCPKCGCKKVYAKPVGRRMGVFCSDCNSWICWTTYKGMLELYKSINEEELNDKISIRKIFKKNGVTKMLCSKCQCLLYNSNSPKIIGQFDLVDAKYCPRCGRELF